MTISNICLTALILLSATVSLVAQTGNGWLEDYAAIKKYMAEAYANIDWARTRIDLVDLDRRTTERLKRATSEQEAQKAMMEFFAAFHDGHLRLQKVAPAADQSSPPMKIGKDVSGDQACRALGFSSRVSKFTVPFEGVSGFRRVGSVADPFLAGVFQAGSRKIGVINIAIFSSDNYFGNCIAAWEEYRNGIENQCDDECRERFKTAAEKRLTERLVEQVRSLARERIDALVIDIGLNGGGSDWAETIAAVFSRSELSRPPVRFIRHPHWVRILESQLADIKFDLNRRDLSKAQKDLLVGARKKLKAFIAEARETCDLGQIWTTKRLKNECTRLVAEPLEGGLAPDAAPDLIANLRSRNSLKRSVPFDFEKGIFDGKLYVLVDRKTASASELFASMLQSSKAATIIGGRTLGAGCGYVDGGTDYFLPVSKLRLRMPDCARFRVDGVNEVEGIEPDVKLFGAEESPEAKLEKLIRYLGSE